MRSRNFRSFLVMLCLVGAIAAVAGLGGVKSGEQAGRDVTRLLFAADPTSPAQDDGSRRGKIINGTKAGALGPDSPLRSASRVVILTDGRVSSFCSATWVAQRFLVTAAHCVANDAGGPRLPKNFYVSNGRSDLTAPMDKLRSGVHPQNIPAFVVATAVKVHPSYNASAHTNDVAVLEVATPSEYPPTKLAGPNERGTWGGGYGRSLAAGGVRIAGFGLTRSGVASSLSDVLMHAAVPSLSDAECARQYGATFKAASMLCGGIQSTSAGNGVDSCSGDSGGPMLGAMPDGSVRLVGVVSFGPSTCASTYAVGAYARVDAMRPWIEQAIGHSVSGGGSFPATPPAVTPTPTTPTPTTPTPTPTTPTPTPTTPTPTTPSPPPTPKPTEVNAGSIQLTSPTATMQVGPTGSTPLTWTLIDGAVASMLYIKQDDVRYWEMPVAGAATSASIDHSLLRTGFSWVCVELVVPMAGDPAVNDCELFVRSATTTTGGGSTGTSPATDYTTTIKASVSSARLKGRTMRFNGTVTAPARYVTVQVRYRYAGRWHTTRKLNDVSAKAWPSSGSFSVVVPWRGRAPRSLQVETIVWSAGTKRAFKGFLR